jgi:septal ring factor EnvC (AmiA/AmiB activator)
MMKLLSTFFACIFFANIAFAQPTREELEKEKQQLKKEMGEIEKLKKENASKTKGTFVEWKMANDKVNLQDRLIDNINHDIVLLDNNLYSIQRDINKFDRLLDTLKQEYAKSMVYAYRNRSNYDFLNFIFSANSFNEAIKRIAYLKSYRNYRQMQGENITRAQELRLKRVEELTGVKQKKKVVLDDKSNEMDELEKQKLEKDRILGELKKKGRQLENQFALKAKQYKKVSGMIAAAIEKARKDAIAKAAAAEKERLKEAARIAALNKTVTTPATKPATSTVVKAPVIKAPKEPVVSVLLNPENVVLNTKFENNHGSLPWPVDKGYLIMHFGLNELPSGTILDNPGLTIGTDIGSSVKAVFEGDVSTIQPIDNFQVVIIQHGRYFSTYSNLNGIVVQKGQHVTLGQTLGKAMANDEGVGSIDFIMSNEKSNFDPGKWLRRM